MGLRSSIASASARLIVPVALAVMLFSSVHTANAETSPSTIVASWRAREAKIKSARIEWIQRRLDKKGSIGGNYSASPYPAEDTEYEGRYLLELDGENVRMEYHGPMWIRSRPGDASPGTLRDYSVTTVFSDGISKDLTVAEEGHFGSIFHNSIEDENALAFFRTPSAWLPVWYVRPFLVPKRELLFGNHSTLTVLPESVPDEIICGGFADTGRMTVDPVKMHLITHLVAYKYELRITYKDDNTFSAIPHQWTLVEQSPHGDIRRVQSCEITRLELNQPIPAERFSLTFPVGTKVTDENGNAMEANAAGQLVPIALIPPPPDRSRLGWLLVTTVVLGILVVVYVRAKRMAT